MFISMFKSKLHRATVTEANLNYVGSITIDKDLMRQADILTGEKVQVVNINNGARLDTYTIDGEAGSGIICLNGAAARLVQPKDKVIIISYALMDKKEARGFEPKVLVLDDDNRIINIKNQEEHGKVE